MTKPLSENPEHSQILCSLLDIGTSVFQPSRVYGGFHHKMWRLETDRGIYAVKQLSADTDFNKSDIINHYNVTEAIAEAFVNKGISAVFALKNNLQYLQILEGTGYLVYPWSNAVALDKDQITEKQAIKIAGVLANMHQANIVVPGLKEPQLEIHTDEKILEWVNKASECGVRNAKALDDELPAFYKIAYSHKAAIKIIEKHQVISHGDLDQKNVLWDVMGDPVLIDWESARALNPTYEIVLEALDWSGITSEFDSGLFKKILSAYKQAGGEIEADSLQASFDCILGDWLNWLIYSIARAVDPWDEEQRSIGAKQVDSVLPTILRLKHLQPELLLIARIKAGI